MDYNTNMSAKPMTPLKRVAEDRWEYLQDVILKQMYDVHVNPLQMDPPVNLVWLSQNVEASKREIHDVVGWLVQEGYMSAENGNYYRLTPEGVRHISKLLSKIE